MRIYVVAPGDTVDSIAENQHVPVQSIIINNQIPYPYRLAVGQALLLPFAARAEKERPDLISNGYAYPFISPWVLRETLPYLSQLSVFSYGFTEEGELIPPATDDTWMIREAVEFNTDPILTLTPIDADGRFNSHLISAIVNNPDARQRLIWELGSTMQQKGFRGVNLDFEYILPEDREPYAQFVMDVRRIMNIFGYEVSVALAPKYSARQQGVLYEGMDYRLLGEAANHVLLMTYEWGYTYGAPMAVAPVNLVRRVVEYAVTEIPREKISLGIPNYGYDWALPYEQGVTRAQTIGNVEAVQRAIDFGVPIQYDETAQTPFYHYWQYGVEHEVWFEDVRSLQAKFDLIKEFGLAGAGYWQIMQLFRANWLLLNDNFTIQKTDDF